jgi:YfiR/HmsC-like
MPPPAAVARFVRAVSAGAAFAAFGLTPLAPVGATAAEVTEMAVKAAYLYNFGLFVEWPKAAFPTAGSPFTICIVGSDPFGVTLDDSVKGQKIRDHPIVVKRLISISRSSGCHIAYVARTLMALQDWDLLTVTDGETSGDQAGIINFVIKDGRVRFVIDDAAAALGGLTISSRLLNLALVVKQRQ